MCSVNEPAHHCEDITASQLCAALLEDFEAKFAWLGGNISGGDT